MRFLIFVACFISLSNVSAFAQWHDWKSKHYRDHPLVGAIYSPSENQNFESTEVAQLLLRQLLVKKITETNFVLLGENHDNPDHHILQAWMIEEIASSGRKPDVVFEMIPRRLAHEANSYDLQKDPQLEDFAKRLEWEKRGWYSWEIYKPVGLATAQYGLRMLAGNISRKKVLGLYRNKTALSTDEQNRFAIDQPFSHAHQSSLNEELIASHCGMIGKKALPAMTRIQRAKDGSMADALLNARSQDGAILIAGNGHVRKDRGVPLVLRKSSQTNTARIKEIVSIGLIEVRENILDPKQYELQNPEGEILYDIVIFTPKADITDHCVAMRKQFKSKKKTNNG